MRVKNMLFVNIATISINNWGFEISVKKQAHEWNRSMFYCNYIYLTGNYFVTRLI